MCTVPVNYFARMSLLLACIVSSPVAAQRVAREVTEAEAWALHARILTLDTHVDIGEGFATAQLDPGGFTSAQVDLPKMRAGGLGAAFFIVYVGQGALDAEGYAQARDRAEEMYLAIKRMVRAYPGQIGLARTADEVEQIHASGRLVALLGMENGYPLGASLDDIPLWAERAGTMRPRRST